MRYRLRELKIFLSGAFILTSLEVHAIDATPATRATWDGAFVYVPVAAAAHGTECIGSLASSLIKSCYQSAHTPQPNLIFIYMHGCDGVNQKALDLLKDLNQMYVAPDSLRRPGRKLDCRVSADKKEIMGLRDQELDYAIAQIRAKPELKNTKIVLMGFSEGATTVALHKPDVEAARIIVAWSCHSADSWYRGIRSNKNVPVLALEGEKDHYLQNVSNRGDCSEYLTNKKSKSIVLPNRDHQILPETETKKAIEQLINTLSSDGQGENSRVPSILGQSLPTQQGSR